MPIKERYYHIDLIRFVFSVIIVYFHIIPYIMQVYTNPLYEELHQLNKYSSHIVDCFLLIGGVFLYRSYKAKPTVSVFEYICSRVVRLWPVLVISLLVESITSQSFDWQKIIIKSAFLQCSGISLDVKGILWYVSAFFFASIFLYAILRNFSENMSGFIISLISYFSVVFLINFNNGNFGGRETVFYVLNLGVLRAVAFTGIGILIGIVCEKVQHIRENSQISPRKQTIFFILKLIIEIGSIFFMYKFFLQALQVNNRIILIIIFSIFLFCLLSQNDPLGILLNRKSIGYVGRYAYSIYVMQDVSFDILRMTLWKNEALVSNVYLNLILSVSFSVLLGIVTYYIIEKPTTTLYQRWCRKQKHTPSNPQNLSI